ncbi:MAG: hypothetical protein CVU56_13890 [Deltaproteobacteria bacterium HGW-Deltaproteobacteria-14]|jgi:signal transduction histidine kinase/CheY-like chemotaxis protein|nr:MAG: hypothetical protein CVU56_13890 [Deltaproteobacteria bacterium HGW-Deltaproteobacteria-14]
MIEYLATSDAGSERAEPCGRCAELEARVAQLDKELRHARRHVARVEELAARAGASAERHRKLIMDAHAQLQLQAGRAEAAARAKSAFLANMSHEIRTPMNGLLGMLELLRDASLDDSERDYLETAFTAARNLLGLLDDVLDYSKVEAGQMEPEAVEFDVDELIEGQCVLMAAAAYRRGMVLAAVVGPEVPARVRGSVRHLRQILNNLLSNAIKFTESGHVAVELGWDHERGALEIVVADTGVGIPPDRVAQIFEPFSQADTTVTRRYGGSGLGLAIVGQLVRLNEGSISVDSRPGEGTRFTVFFPVTPTRQSPATKRIKSRVGVAVGDQLTARSLRAMLRRMNVEAVEVDDNADPEYCDAKGVSLVLGDLEGMSRQAGADGPRCDRRWIQLVDPWRPAPLPPPFTPEGIVHLPLRHTQLADVLEGEGGCGAFRHPAPPPLAFAPLGSDSASSLGTVLVVEDNLINQLVVRKLVERAGYTCVVVENGAVALERVAEREFDAVLMDVHMPVMDGYTATRRIREMVRPGRRRPPIIALTASAMEEDRAPCFDAGMDAFLTKPIDPSELIDTLDKHTRRARRPAS